MRLQVTIRRGRLPGAAAGGAARRAGHGNRWPSTQLPAAIARDGGCVPSAVVIRSHEGAPFRHSPILPIFVENEPRPAGHYIAR